MFRRRPPRRRPGGPRPIARQALRRAHQALERGDTEQATQIFLRLAKGAARRGMSLRAAGLLMEAAHAEALGGKSQQAVQHARRALRNLPPGPPPRRIVATTERLIAALRKDGYEEEAAEVEQTLEQVLQRSEVTRQEMVDRIAAAREQRRGRLPPKCPSCAGPLLPDEVDWKDATTAACPYCGSVVQME